MPIKTSRASKCAYCGVNSSNLEREHVIPKCLYAASNVDSTIQRITVPACPSCNRGWSDDEAHFRNVLLIAGESNEVVKALWTTKANRSFDRADGSRRVRELLEHTKPTMVNGEERLMIYPADDQRVLRVIRKIVRGLSSFHGIESAVINTRVWVDVHRFSISEYLTTSRTICDGGNGVAKYWYVLSPGDGLASFWHLTFFGRTGFIATVEQVR